MVKPGKPSKMRGSILIGVLVILFIMSVVVQRFVNEAAREIQYQSQFQGQEDMRSQAYCLFDTALAVLHEIKEIDGQLYRPVQGWADPLAYAGIPLPEGFDARSRSPTSPADSLSTTTTCRSGTSCSRRWAST